MKVVISRVHATTVKVVISLVKVATNLVKAVTSHGLVIIKAKVISLVKAAINHVLALIVKVKGLNSLVRAASIVGLVLPVIILMPSTA